MHFRGFKMRFRVFRMHLRVFRLCFRVFKMLCSVMLAPPAEHAMLCLLFCSHNVHALALKLVLEAPFPVT